MSEDYNWENIHRLLVEGFTAGELRLFCFGTDSFREVYYHLSRGDSRAECAERLLDYAQQTSQVEEILSWAKTQNPRRYQVHRPYRGQETRQDAREKE